MEKNLQNEEARKKLKELAEEVKICMFATTDSNDYTYGRPMSTMQVDDEGALWFFTKEHKKITDEVAADNKVSLLYAHPGKNTYLTIQGTSAAVKDRKKMEELYTPALKGWFPEGLDEPGIVLLKVVPEQAHYWDATEAKLVILLSMVKAAITGTPSNIGESGYLNI